MHHSKGSRDAPFEIGIEDLTIFEKYNILEIKSIH